MLVLSFILTLSSLCSANFFFTSGVRDAAVKEKRQRLGKGGELGSDDEEQEQQQEPDSSEDEADQVLLDSQKVLRHIMCYITTIYGTYTQQSSLFRVVRVVFLAVLWLAGCNLGSQSTVGHVVPGYSWNCMGS